MTDSALAEPGILLRMVLPEPDEAGLGAANGGPAPRAVAAALLVAALAGWTLAWFGLEATASAFTAAGVDAPRLMDWLVPASCGVAGALLGAWRCADLVVFAALAVGALAGATGNDAARRAVHAFAVGAAVVLQMGAAVPARSWPAIATSAAAGMLATAVWPHVGPALGALGAAVVSAAGILLLAALRRRPSTAVRTPRLAVHVAASFVVVAMLWWAAPPTWWRGIAGVPRLGFAGLGAAALVGLAGGQRVLAVVAAGLAVVVMPRVVVPVQPANREVLAAERTTLAVYERSTQAMLLLVDGEVVDAAAEESAGAELATTLVRTFARAGDRVLVVGEGSGRISDLLPAAGLHDVEVIDPRSAASPAQCLRRDGPVAVPGVDARPAAVRRRIGSRIAALRALPAGSRQFVVVAESPAVEGTALATVAAQDELRRVAGTGFVLQAIALDVADPEAVRRLLTAAAQVQPWNAVFAVGGAALLVSAGAPPAWPEDAASANWPVDARWIAHAAHLGGPGDVQRALLGTVRSDTEGAVDPDAGAGRRAVVAVLRSLLQPLPMPEAPPAGSTLLRWLGRCADVRSAVAAIRELRDDPADAAKAQAIAARFLHVGAPAAVLQAALGLPDAEDVRLTDPRAAALRAHAIDPALADDLPPVLRALPAPNAARGELEDLARLPTGDRLVELCTADTPLAVALRTRFPSRCARALVDMLARAPLPPARVAALRELADPFVLAEAARVLRTRGGLEELLALWRADLPMPAALGALRDGGPAARRLFAAALGGRRDQPSLAALADCLAADDIEVRRAAASSVRATAGADFAYDPEGQRSGWIEAAERLRTLHNRRP